MSTTTVQALVTTNTETAWEYISGGFTTILPYVIGLTVLGILISIVLRKLGVLGRA